MSSPRRPKKSCVVFGAGAIGLGFLGDLLDQSGYRTTFVDVRPDVLEWLNAHGSYEIRVTNERGARVRRIRNVRALDSREYGKNPATTRALEEALAEADLCWTAAGEAALEPIGRLLAGALRLRVQRGRPPLNIICCENIQDPAAVLRRAMENGASAGSEGAPSPGARPEGPDARPFVAISRSVISRMTPVVSDPRRIVTEDYSEIPVEKATWVGPPPDVVGVRLVDDFEAYKMRKLIVHNMTHAVAAYLGYFLEKKDVCECVADPSIARACRAALGEARAIIAAEYGLPEDELRAHADDLFRRYANPSLGHTVPNVARDPMRKLAKGDRFEAALALAAKHAIRAPAAELGAAFALNYDHPDDVSARALQRRLAEQGVGPFLREHMGLPLPSPLAERLGRLYQAVRAAVAEARASGDASPVRRLLCAPPDR